MADTETALYRHFDAEGRLLYVGIALNAIERLSKHMRAAHWSRDIARVEITRFPSRREALKQERAAIEAEKPLHNTHFQGVDAATARLNARERAARPRRRVKYKRTPARPAQQGVAA